MSLFTQNTKIIYLNQMLGTVSLPVIIILGGFIGVQLLEDKSYATLPVFMMMAGITIFLFPSGYIMKSFGRKPGFILGSIFGLVGCLILVYAVEQRDFSMFCLGSFFFGMQNSFVRQYRFGLADELHPNNQSMGIGVMLTAGIVAAVIGPMIVNGFGEVDEHVYVFYVLFLFNIISIVSFLFYAPEKPVKVAGSLLNPSQFGFLKRRKFWVPSIVDTSAFIVMVLLMAAVPVHMKMNGGFGLKSASNVILWHIVFMYLPSFIVGYLIKKYGVPSVILIGYGVFMACLSVLYFSDTHASFVIGMVLLGVGWNLLYMSSTTLNIMSFSNDERYYAQSAHEFVSMIFQTLASFFSGWLLMQVGWNSLLSISIVVVILSTFYFSLNRSAWPNRAMTVLQRRSS